MLVIASVLGGFLVGILENPLVQEAIAGGVATLVGILVVLLVRQLKKVGVDLDKAQQEKLADIIEDSILLAEEVIEDEIKERVAGGEKEEVVRKEVKLGGAKLNLAVKSAAKQLEKAAIRPVGKVLKRALSEVELEDVVRAALPKVSIKNGLKLGVSISKRF